MYHTCRFCLKQTVLASGIPITQKMANSYFEITNKRLTSSFELSSISCIVCANKLSALSKDIKNLTINEETLVKNLATRQNVASTSSIQVQTDSRAFQCGGCFNYFNSKENLIAHRNQECRKQAPPVAALKPLQPAALKPIQPAVPSDPQQRTDLTSALVSPARLRRTSEFIPQRLPLGKARAGRSNTISYSPKESECIPCDYPECTYSASSVSLRVHKVLAHKMKYVDGRYVAEAGNKPARAGKRSKSSYQANDEIMEDIPSSQRSSQRLSEKRGKRMKRD